MPKHYPPEFRSQAVRLIAQLKSEGASRTEAIERVSARLGCSRETIRRWLLTDEIDTGVRPGTTSEESAEIHRLKRENAELRRANEILKTASAFFAAELDRPTTR